PPDRVLRFGVANDELVLGAAPGVLAGLDNQRPVLGQAALAIGQGLLDQGGGAEIGADFGGGRNALIGKRNGKRTGHVSVSIAAGNGPLSGGGLHRRRIVAMPRSVKSRIETGATICHTIQLFAAASMT